MGQFWSRLAHLVFIGALVMSLIVFSTPVGAQTPPSAQRALIVPGATPLGRTAATEPLSLTVALQPRTPTAIDTFLSALTNPASPDYHHYLTPQQFTDRFFDATARTQVVGYLRGQGLTVTDHGTGAILDVSGAATQIERTFNVTLTNYRDTQGRAFHAADRTPAIATALAGKVAGITGFSNRSVAYPKAVTPRPGGKLHPHDGTPQGCPAAVTAASDQGAFTPNELATAYDVQPLLDQGYHGEGQTVALFELDNYKDSNIATFQQCFGTAVRVSRVAVNGGFPNWMPNGNGQVEVELDIEVVAGIAPRLSHLLVYEGTGADDATQIEVYQAIANDDLASVVSTSWGECELDPSITPDIRASENLIFQQYAAQGQSFFNAIGDTGSAECIPNTGSNAVVADEIGSNPYVTDVGGTTLALDATNAIVSETVWNHAGLAGGGGISQFYPRPDYQTGPGTANAFSNGHRQSPDVTVAGDPATGYLIYTNASGPPPNELNTWNSVGGTSAGAPFYAAAFALVNQKVLAKGGAPLGFVNPTLYALWRANSTFVHDITEGDNCLRSGNPSMPAPCEQTTPVSYPTTSGYDMASGIGSLDLFAFSEQYLNTVTLTTTTLPAATVGQAYQTQLTFPGATTFTLIQGTLPAGLTLSMSGLLSGTPSQAGPASFTVQASNGGGPLGSQPYTLTVAQVMPTLAATTNPVAPIVGEAVTFTATLALPAGIDPAVTISGTVAFAIDGTPIAGCTAQPVAGNVATCTTTAPAAKAHRITATYSGNSNVLGVSATDPFTTFDRTVTFLTVTAPTGAGSGNGGTDTMPVLRPGASLTLQVIGTYNDGTTGPVSGLTFSSDNGNVAVVDATGKVTGIANGTATITITAPGGAATDITVTVGMISTGGMTPPNMQPNAHPAGATNGTQPAPQPVRAPNAGQGGGLSPQAGNAMATPSATPNAQPGRH